jgi:hypothetical protein
VGEFSEYFHNLFQDIWKTAAEAECAFADDEKALNKIDKTLRYYLNKKSFHPIDYRTLFCSIKIKETAIIQSSFKK